MSEKNFWTFVKKNLKLKMYRVENRVSSGMPDIHYISEEGSGWIELKYIKELPKKGSVKSGLRRAQSIWHDAYQRNGGQSWILLRVGRRDVILINGCHALDISKGMTSVNFLRKSSWSHRGNFDEGIWDSLKGAINAKDKENIRSVGEGK